MGSHPSTQPKQTTPANSDLYSQQFLELLVEASLGIKIEDIPNQKRENVMADLLEVFENHIDAYIEKHYSRSDMIKIKTARKNGIDIFSKFPGLQEEYLQAEKAYFESI